jgi:biotin carboxyl carrier protein
MKLEVYHGDDLVEIELPDSNVGQPVLIAGREADVDWVRIRECEYSILIAGRVFDLTVEPAGERAVVHGRDGAAQLRVSDPRRGASPEVEGGKPGLQRVVAEMPGKVIRVMARAGDAVALGQGLLVLEAMKMQNEIRATRPGVVESAGAAAGDTVEAGAALVSIRSDKI